MNSYGHSTWFTGSQIRGLASFFWLSCSVDKSQISAFTVDAESFNSPSVILIGDKHMWEYHVRRNDQTQTWLRLHFIADTKPNTTDKYIGHYFIEFHDNVNGRSYVIITYSLYNCNHKCKIFEKRIHVKPRSHPLKRKVFDMMIFFLQLSVSYTRGMPDDQFAFYADNELQGGFTLPAMRGNVRLGHTFMLMPGQTNVAAIYRASDQIENESWSSCCNVSCELSKYRFRWSYWPGKALSQIIGPEISLTETIKSNHVPEVIAESLVWVNAHNWVRGYQANSCPGHLVTYQPVLGQTGQDQICHGLGQAYNLLDKVCVFVPWITLLL